jgi:hypothetical protein
VFKWKKVKEKYIKLWIIVLLHDLEGTVHDINTIDLENFLGDMYLVSVVIN